MNSKHLDLIRAYCKVFAEVLNGIWYEDRGFKVAEIYIEGEGWVSFSCNTKEEFDLLCE